MMTEEFRKFKTNIVVFSEKVVIKEECEDDFIDNEVFPWETIAAVNDVKLKDNKTLNEISLDLETELPSYAIRNITINNQIKIEDETNTGDAIKIESPVDNIKTESSSSSRIHNITINDEVKIEDEAHVTDVKIEFNNKLLYCNYCCKDYQDYCTKCGMLMQILNRNAFGDIHKDAREEMPKNILEIREPLGSTGIFALKVIPVGVRFGPFTGIYTSERFWRIKAGKFVVSNDRWKFLNWMKYIRSSNSISEQNLIASQCHGNIYYRSSREIWEGEELLVYFGEKYEERANKDVEIIFTPPTDSCVEDVFACTYCCLGFSSKEYLSEHKNVCLYGTKEISSFEDLMQCQFCKVYLEKEEYLKYHMKYCCEVYVSQCAIPTEDDQKDEVKMCLLNKRKRKHRGIYKCSQCDYKTKYKCNLKRHTNKHSEVKIYECDSCSKKFKRSDSLKEHVENVHEEKRAQEASACNYECKECPYKTNRRGNLDRHISVKHLEATNYQCEECQYKTNHKPYLEAHIKTKHVKESDFKCDECEFRTNYKSNLTAHIKMSHLKEISHDCTYCDYKTYNKSNLKVHIRAIHLKANHYKCQQCEYKTCRKQDLNKHTSKKHTILNISDGNSE